MKNCISHGQRCLSVKGGVAALALLALGAAAPAQSEPTPAGATMAILETYSSIAWDNYSDALADAKLLKASLEDFSRAPDAPSFMAAKMAWLKSRESYGQTEAFRLSEGPIDSEEGWVAGAYGSLEGQINAWPLDEMMIDYTVDSQGVRTRGNIVDAPSVLGTTLFKPSGSHATPVDVAEITPDVLEALNENGSGSNVASGYHAIEFLLWGQDQDYGDFARDQVTPGALKAGQRPLTDFTTDSLARRRLDYLKAAASKLVDDLQTIANAWHPRALSPCASDAKGCYRAALLGRLGGVDAAKNVSPAVAVRKILMGLGTFIKSELANERIAVAVLTPSEEDEHSCFSDNTHRDIWANFQGFVNLLKGSYGARTYGPSFYSATSDATQRELGALISQISADITKMDELARTRWHFDYQILPGNHASELKAMKNRMRALGDRMVDVAASLGIDLETGDVTDPDETRI